MKYGMTGVGFIRVTTLDGVKRVLNTSNLRSIEECPTGRFITTYGAKNLSYIVSETMTAIYNQQNSTNHHLGMLRVTEVIDNSPLANTTNDLILFTQTIHKIVKDTAPASTKSKVIFNENGKRKGSSCIVNETLAAIMAMQSTTKHLGLMLVTRIDPTVYDNATGALQRAQFIFNIAYIEYILADTTTVTGANSRLVFDGAEKDIYCLETEAAIFAAQPV
jgi:uncharacterized protein YlzI (FlbEa/FlbD family)